MKYNHLSLSILFLSIILSTQVHSHVIDITGQKIQEMTMFYKRFVFSDFRSKNQQLVEAFAEGDLKFWGHKLESPIKVFSLVVNGDIATEMIFNLEAMRKEGQLNNVEDVEQTLQIFKNQVELYQTQTIDANKQEYTYVFNTKIHNEGVYYFLLFYAPFTQAMNNTYSILTGQQNINEITEKDSYLTITGNITFKNTHGYLNAEQYPLINFYIASTVVYFIAIFIWGFMLYKFKEYLIVLHHFVTILLVLGLIESIFMYFEYYTTNEEGRRSFSFLVTNIFLLAVRSTVSLMIILLVSLGYGITVNSVEKYQPQIAMLSFIYLVSNAIYWTVVYINHTQPLSKVLILMVSLPISFCNSIYWYWILASLRRTVSQLKEKKQDIKLAIIRKFALSIVIAIGVAGIFFVLEVLEKFILDRDLYWKLEWIFYVCWFVIFSGFLFWIMILFRPTEQSQMLAQMEQIHETSMTQRSQNESIEMTEHNKPVIDGMNSDQKQIDYKENDEVEQIDNENNRESTLSEPQNNRRSL